MHSKGLFRWILDVLSRPFCPRRPVPPFRPFAILSRGNALLSHLSVPPFCPSVVLSREIPPNFGFREYRERPNFLLNAEISSLTEPDGHYYIIPPVSFNRCPLESGYENKDMPFCPGTERWDRTPGTKMPFCPRPRRFVPGQKGGTERTVKTGYFLLFPSFKKKTANFIRLNIFFLRTKSQCNLTCQKALNNLSELTKEFFNLCPLLARM